jgi:hypothetical protein
MLFHCLFHGRYLVTGLRTTISRFISCVFMLEEIIFFTLKMEAAGSFKLLVAVYQATRCHIPEDHNLNIHCHGNLKSHADLCICYRLWNQELHRAKTWGRGPSLFRVLVRCFGVNAIWLGLTMACCEFFFR